MTYIYSTKITRSKWIYLTISQDQKGLLQFGMGHCVSDFSQKLLAYVIDRIIHQVASAAILMISAIREYWWTSLSNMEPHQYP
jgi:hypothetical protein